MSRYYYAGGRRVDLDEDEEHVAVDQRRAQAAGLTTDIEGASRLPGGLLIVPRASLDAPQLARLRDAGALRPVYRRDRALIVALPEVRVELDNPKQRRAVMDAIAKCGYDMAIAEESDDRIVLHPKSDNADEALAVANYVYEQAHPAAASVRFVQVVPKRDTSK